MTQSSVQLQVIVMLLTKFLFYPGGLFTFKLGFCAFEGLAGYYRGKLMRSSSGQFRPEKKKKNPKLFLLKLCSKRLLRSSVQQDNGKA